MEKMTMNISEFADTLGVSVKAIYNRRDSAPHTLPEPLDIPGQRTLIWLRDDVHRWLLKFSPNRRDEPVSRPRGRPRKNP